MFDADSLDAFGEKMTPEECCGYGVTVDEWPMTAKEQMEPTFQTAYRCEEMLTAVN